MGNFSRDSFDKLKRYVGIRLQQGVPIVDADWNESEDIRKHELQTFLKWFVGNGVPEGNDGFRILPHPEGTENDFTIKGGENGQPGCCLVDGREVQIGQNINYSGQQLFQDETLAAAWGVSPLQPLSPAPLKGGRTDTVYLDVWEREVDAVEDDDLINPAIGIETCVRVKREWVVRVTQGGAQLPVAPKGHGYYEIAKITRTSGTEIIFEQDITDVRHTGLTLSGIKEYIDADNTVTSAKIRNADSASGQDATYGDGIKTSHIQNKAVSREKIADFAVSNAKLGNSSVSEDKLSTAIKLKLVTNGNNHDHFGDDGATIKHSSLNKDDGTNPHGTTAQDVGALPITEGADYIRIGDVQFAWGHRSHQNLQGQNLSVTVNLPVPFKGYTTIIFQRDPDFTGYRKNLALKSQSSHSFVVWSPSGQGTTYYFDWFTVGKWR